MRFLRVSGMKDSVVVFTKQEKNGRLCRILHTSGTCLMVLFGVAAQVHAEAQCHVVLHQDHLTPSLEDQEEE